MLHSYGNASNLILEVPGSNFGPTVLLQVLQSLRANAALVP
jgi:hypothetical protein